MTRTSEPQRPQGVLAALLGDERCPPLGPLVLHGTIELDDDPCTDEEVHAAHEVTRGVADLDLRPHREPEVGEEQTSPSLADRLGGRVCPDQEV